MEIRIETLNIPTVGDIRYTLTYSEASGEYGIQIENTDTGESAGFAAVSPDRDRVSGIFDSVVRGSVTPITLGDILYDLLCL